MNWELQPAALGETLQAVLFVNKDRIERHHPKQNSSNIDGRESF